MRRKTKIIWSIINAIAIIIGFGGMYGFAKLWECNKHMASVIASLICFILFIGGIISAIIVKYIDRFTYNKTIKRKTIEYQSNKNNEEQLEEENENHGERLVKILIGQTVAGEQYVINNLILTNEEKTKSSQIDHVFINKYGIWCIETKDWGGMIFGKETDNTWTQVFKYGEEKYKHYNPIKQNETHIKYLNKALNYNKEIHNIIVFTNGDISNVQAENTYDVEMLYYRLWKCNRNIELTKEEMEIIYNKLIQIKATQISDEQHVINVNSRIA